MPNERLEFALCFPPLFIRGDALEYVRRHFDLPADAEGLTQKLGGLILDLGSGYEDLACAVYDHGDPAINAKIVCLNPQLVLDEVNKTTCENWTKHGIDDSRRLALAGLVQAMPFADDTFDSIISLSAFPDFLYYFGPEEYAVAYGELARVLKPGGTAYLGPLELSNNRLAVNLLAISAIEGLSVQTSSRSMRTQLIVSKG